jgi:hypothetical protein
MADSINGRYIDETELESYKTCWLAFPPLHLLHATRSNLEKARSNVPMGFPSLQNHSAQLGLAGTEFRCSLSSVGNELPDA